MSHKKIVSIILIFLISMIPTVYGEASVYENYAEKLSKIGVFIGNNNGYELDRVSNRSEALVLLIRLQGKEDMIISNKGLAPFSDINTWVKNYVEYAYENGLTQGISATKFGGDRPLDSKAFTTFMLRCLEYDDSQKDFTYNESITFAKSIGLYDDEIVNLLNNSAPNRGIIAQILYLTLKQETKNGQVLVDKLIASGDISEENALLIGLTNKEDVQQRIKVIKRNYAAYLSLKVDKASLFKVVPKLTPPYNAGTLSDISLNQALKATIFIRSLSDLNNQVYVDKEWNKEAQNLAMLSILNKQLSHFPSRPNDVSDEDYASGYSGGGTSNIYLGWENLDQTLFQFMDDSDESNIAVLGHRRWLLNPGLTHIGYGWIGQDVFPKAAAAVKVFDASGLNKVVYSEGFEYVLWPNKTAFPINLMNAKVAWSISLNTEIYDASRTNSIQVVITQKASGKKWSFEAKNKGKELSNGYFNIDTTGYGIPFCIIFRPNDIAYSEGDIYQVAISNVYGKDGSKKTIHYETTLFDLNED